MKPSEKPMDKIDQLFKNKLDDHSLTPSENAWEKVEAGLSKKNRIGGWFVNPWFVSSRTSWRIAAAILLVGALISILIWSQKDSGSAPTLAEKKVLDVKDKVVPQEKSVGLAHNKKQPAVQKEQIQEQNLSRRPELKSKPAEEQVTSREKNNAVQNENQVAVNNQKEEVNEIKTKEKIITNATTKTEIASTRQKPIKLEFTLEEPSVETVATTNETKNTGLKKVLEMAREIKHGEGPVFSLRERKDEFFAHSFISGKQKVQ